MGPDPPSRPTWRPQVQAPRQASAPQPAPVPSPPSRPTWRPRTCPQTLSCSVHRRLAGSVSWQSVPSLGAPSTGKLQQHPPCRAGGLAESISTTCLERIWQVGSLQKCWLLADWAKPSSRLLPARPVDIGLRPAVDRGTTRGHFSPAFSIAPAFSPAPLPPCPTPSGRGHRPQVRHVARVLHHPGPRLHCGPLWTWWDCLPRLIPGCESPHQ